MIIVATGNPPLLPHFGSAHLTALGVTLVLTVLLILAARFYPRARFVGLAQSLLAILLITSYPANILARFWADIEITRDMILPLHLCDVAAVTGFFALVFANRLAAELTYFWGLAGTFQALLTPSTCFDFPSPAFFTFFQLHSGVVIAALYLPIGLGWRPRRGAVLRAWFWGLGYMVAAGAVNLLIGSNYGFLREKAEASLMDFIGPWPAYIGVMAVLALVFFVILALPFCLVGGRENS
ncbi:MAG: TIGR02206 family membrane protein [Planctomycetaceae bacterium]|nr:TIGR02206 family membrane protein [Planctomycetaceae bacterium]